MGLVVCWWFKGDMNEAVELARIQSLTNGRFPGDILWCLGFSLLFPHYLTRLPWQAHQTHRRLCPGLRSAMDEFAVRAALQSLPERVAHRAHTLPPCRKTPRSQPPEDRACLAVVEPVWGVRAQDFQHVVVATVAAPAQCKVSMCLPWDRAGQSGSSLDPPGSLHAASFCFWCSPLFPLPLSTSVFLPWLVGKPWPETG